MLAASVCGFTATAGRCCGRISAKPARKIAYAARMPKAIEPSDAQINIAKFNQSVISAFKPLPAAMFLFCRGGRDFPARCKHHSVIVSEEQVVDPPLCWQIKYP